MIPCRRDKGRLDLDLYLEDPVTVIANVIPSFVIQCRHLYPNTCAQNFSHANSLRYGSLCLSRLALSSDQSPVAAMSADGARAAPS